MQMHKLPMVYIISTEDFKYIKIGKTGSIKNRFGNIQTGCPFKLFFWLGIYTEDSTSIENYLHSEMESKRLHGEWFEPDAEDLDFLQQFSWTKNLETRRSIRALL